VLTSTIPWWISKEEVFAHWDQCILFPSVLKHCWLGDRKAIPDKKVWELISRGYLLELVEKEDQEGLINTRSPGKQWRW